MSLEDLTDPSNQPAAPLAVSSTRTWETGLIVGGRPVLAHVNDEALLILEELAQPIDPSAVAQNPDAVRIRNQSILKRLMQVMGVTDPRELNGILAILPRINIRDGLVLNIADVVQLPTIDHHGSPIDTPRLWTMDQIGRSRIMDNAHLLEVVHFLLTPASNVKRLIVPSPGHPEFRKYMSEEQITQLFGIPGHSDD